MKLLQKEEISKAKQLDRQREIQEGLKLSRKVDSLRELVSKEEETLGKFRNESLTAIMDDIKSLNDEKEELEAKLKPLREERENGLSILKKTEEALILREESVSKRETDVLESEKKIVEREEKIITDEDEIKTRLDNAKVLEEDSKKLHKSAVLKRDEAQNALSLAKKLQEDAKKESELSSVSIKEREDDLKKRENDIVVKESALEKAKKEIEIKRIRLEDQKNTLRRAIERYKNGKRP